MLLIIELEEDWIHNQNVEVPGKQIQLIKEKENGQLELVPESLSIINGLERSVAICGIVGPYRSG